MKTHRPIRQVGNLPNGLKEGSRSMGSFQTVVDRDPLTSKQLKLLRWVEKYIGTNGYSPTVREIASHFDISSLNGVMCHLHAMRKKGYVTWQEKQARTLRVIGGDA
jgi:repressor LexA